MKTLNFKNDILVMKKDFFSKGIVRRNFGELSCDDFYTLGKMFGKLLPIGKHNLSGRRCIQNVSPEGLFGREEVLWHNDFSYSKGSYDGTILYMKSFNIKVPTYFVDTGELYLMLDKEEKDKYSDIVCSFIVPPHCYDLLSDSQLKIVKKDIVKKKLITEHPISGIKTLYFSPATLHKTTKEFNLKKFLEWSEQKKISIDYSINDIVLFDNLRFMHRRPSFAEGSRQIWRISFRYV